jgi:septin family protein
MEEDIQETMSISEVSTFMMPTIGNSPDYKVHLYDTVGYGTKINNQEDIDTIKEFLSDRLNKWNTVKSRRDILEAVSNLLFVLYHDLSISACLL